ncbi:MAG: bifunctional DNA primase/polymerase [Actinomycetota bacterium]
MSPLSAALAYAARGWSVFPCEPCGKRPLGRLVPHGLLDASQDPEQISRWWTGARTANIGISCGPSGLLVLDLDGAEGEASALELQQRHGPLPSDTLWQRTGGGGWQAFFRNPGDLGNTASKIARGIDTRGVGGYVIGSPSIHPSGTAYGWWNEGAAVGPLPAWLHRLLVPARRLTLSAPSVDVRDSYVRAAVEREADTVASASQGARNETLNAAAFSLARLIGEHLSTEQILGALMSAAAACGLPAAEASRTIRSAIAARQRAAS